jgi:uncharacterized protein (TIGR02996 family)
MTPDDAFLADIIQSPDDDGPRLIYADWLDDHGQADRADFIRVQIELARLPQGDPRMPGLKARERALLKEHEQEWLGSLVQLTQDCVFRRGLVEAISIRADTFLLHGEDLLRAAPVREARLGDAWPRMGELVACPHLARLTALDLGGSLIGADGLRALLASPHIGRLRQLGLSGTGIGSVGLDDLVEGERLLPELTALDLGGNGLSDEDAALLAASPLSARLRALELANNDLSDAGVAALTGVGLGQLRSLGLAWNAVGAPGVRALTGSRLWPGLVELDLSYTPVGNAGAEELLAAPLAAPLTALSLVGADINTPLQRALKERFGASVCRFG